MPTSSARPTSTAAWPIHVRPVASSLHLGDGHPASLGDGLHELVVEGHQLLVVVGQGVVGDRLARLPEGLLDAAAEHVRLNAVLGVLLAGVFEGHDHADTAHRRAWVGDEAGGLSADPVGGAGGHVIGDRHHFLLARGVGHRVRSGAGAADRAAGAVDAQHDARDLRIVSGAAHVRGEALRIGVAAHGHVAAGAAQDHAVQVHQGHLRLRSFSAGPVALAGGAELLLFSREAHPGQVRLDDAGHQVHPGFSDGPAACRKAVA